MAARAGCAADLAGRLLRLGLLLAVPRLDTGRGRRRLGRFGCDGGQASRLEGSERESHGHYNRVVAVSCDSYLCHAEGYTTAGRLTTLRQVQRVDLIVDGQVRNVRQRSDLPALQSRVLAAMQTASRVEIVRSAPDHPPPTNPHPLTELAQRVVFFANVTDDAVDAWLRTPKTVRGAISADPGEWSDASARLIALAKAAGRSLSPWCDCREPTGDPPGTPMWVAQEMQRHYGLAEPIGEAESSPEWRHAIDHGARLVVGNPASLTQLEISEARSLCERGRLAFIGEVLRPDPLYSAQGVPIASGLFYVAPGGDVYQPVSSYLSVMPVGFRGGFGVYHAADLQPADWAALT